MPPIVRIETEHLKQTLVKAFSEHLLKEDEDFTAAVDQALREFDFKREITDIARRVLRQQVEETIKNAMYTVFWDQEVKGYLLEALKREIVERLDALKERM